jgi:hypothetical protein
MIGEPYARRSATELHYKLPRKASTWTKKKVGYVLIPPFTLDRGGWIGASTIRVQFCFSVSSPFVFFDYLPLVSQANNNTFSLCVRWRYGHTVHRYKLHSGDSEVALYCPDYQDELIPQHWVLEFWCQQNHSQLILDEACIVKLGMRYYPNSCHDTTDVLESLTTRADDELNLPLPLAIPFVFNDINAWRTNGSGLTADSITVTADNDVILASDEG